MATIITFNTNDSGPTVRTGLNTNFSNLNAALPTINTGVINGLTYYSLAGTTLSQANLFYTNAGGTPTLTIGASGDTGSLALHQGTSGLTTINPGTGTFTLTLPAATDTLVGKTTTDTLTNKTISVGTFSGIQTFNNAVNYTNNAIAASSNAATVPITARLNTVTNSSAATLTITMTTTSAVDGQLTMVRVLDFSGVAQTITWVGTENSSVSAPTTSNGSTTLFLTVGFIFNGATSKWRCLASA